MSSLAKKSRGGRPRLRKVRPGDRVPLGLRVTPEMKRQLEKAAQHSGRSLSQETEFRLERSFDRVSLLEEILTLRYGPRVAGVAAFALDVMHSGRPEISVVETEGGTALVLQVHGPGDRRARFQFEGAADLESVFRQLQQKEASDAR